MKEELIDPAPNFPPLKITPENEEAIWERIVQMEGEVFATVRNTDFTYQINGNGIQIIGNNPYNLATRNFFNAIPHFNPAGPGAFPNNIVGTAYVWGIFNRINTGN